MSKKLLNYHAVDGFPCGNDANASQIADYYGAVLMKNRSLGGFTLGKTYHVFLKVYKFLRKITVCGIIDDSMIAYKWYSKSWGWRYGIEHKDNLEIKIDRAAPFVGGTV